MRTRNPANVSFWLMTALAAAVAGWIALGDRAGAQPAPDPYEKYFWVETATVVDPDPKEGVSGWLTVDQDGERVTYRLADTALVRKGSETIDPAALEEGDRVAISAHRGESQASPVADTVTVVIVDPQTGEPRSRSPQP